MLNVLHKNKQCLSLLYCFRKLKLYEEQELTMQVFCEPENVGIATTPPQPLMERPESADFSQVTHIKFFIILP
jgi:hypothetical protein